MFKKSEYEFKSCIKLPFDIDLNALRTEFEEEIKPNFAS